MPSTEVEVVQEGVNPQKMKGIFDFLWVLVEKYRTTFMLYLMLTGLKPEVI